MGRIGAGLFGWRDSDRQGTAGFGHGSALPPVFSGRGGPPRNGLRGVQDAQDGRHARELGLSRARGRKVEAQEGAAGFEPRPDFQQFQPEGVELGAGEFGAFEQVVAQRVHQHVGGGMEEQPELVGFIAVATRPVRPQGRLDE